MLGTTLGWCSPVQPQLRRNATLDDAPDGVWQLSLNDDQMSWVGSLINGGALIGSVCGGVLMDRFGRKLVLLAVFVGYTLGWALITLAIDPGKRRSPPAVHVTIDPGAHSTLFPAFAQVCSTSAGSLAAWPAACAASWRRATSVMNLARP